MKILQINTESTWRGGERQTLISMDFFKILKNEVHLIAKENSPMYTEACKSNHKVFGVKSNLKAIIKIISISKNYDIVHAQTAKALTQCAIAKFFCKFKLVYTRRVDFIPSGFFTKIKYKKANSVISISKAIHNILESNKIFNNTEIIYSAYKKTQINKRRIEEIYNQTKISKKKKIIGIVAALEEHKDPITSIKTCSEILKKRNDIVFLHFGKGSYKNQIEDLIKKYDIGENYLLMGHHENVEELFDLMDVFLMTSKEEGLGSSVLDAFLRKIIVVSTLAGGLKELVSDRGYLCSIGDYKCLSKSLELALEKNKTNTDIVNKAYKYCLDNHNPKIMAKKYLNVYKKLT